MNRQAIVRRECRIVRCGSLNKSTDRQGDEHGEDDEEQEKKRARMIMIRKNLKGLGFDV